MLVSVSLASGSIVVSNGTSDVVNNGGLIDNVPIEGRGIYPSDIPLSLLNLPVYYTRITFSNRNDITINVIQEYKLETRDGRVLFEFTWDRPYPIPQNYSTQMQLFTRYHWKTFDYNFGFFDLTFGLYIKEDGSYTKLVFHGFVFGFGTMILNPYGEKLE